MAKKLRNVSKAIIGAPVRKQQSAGKGIAVLSEKTRPTTTPANDATLARLNATLNADAVKVMRIAAANTRRVAGKPVL